MHRMQELEMPRRQMLKSEAGKVDLADQMPRVEVEMVGSIDQMPRFAWA